MPVMGDHRRATILLHLARWGSPTRPPSIAPDLVLRGAPRGLQTHLKPATISRLIALRRSDAAERELERAGRAGVHVAIPGDPHFPEELVDHPLGPPLLYIAGTLPRGPRIAIIGARRCRSAMLRFARELGQTCAQHAVPVVSGLARGIDAAAHAGCLEASGEPVGVLGTGIDLTYPPEHQRLHAQVAERGALVTTFPFGFTPRPYAFPARNRLVAALSTTVCVVQASLRSGTMSTAAAALCVNTEVVAVPGPQEDEDSMGTNRLIRDGARPILCAADLLEPLVGFGALDSPAPSRARSPDHRTQEDDPILRAIAEKGLSPEELTATIGLPLAEIQRRLIDLELEGRVLRAPGRRYRQT